MGHDPQRIRPRMALLLFASFFLVALLICYSGLNAPMYYDSAGNIAEKKQIFQWGGLRGVLDLFPQRPLPIATFYANFLIADMVPLWFRVFNMALLAGTSLMVVLLLSGILNFPGRWNTGSSSQKRWISVGLGLLFLLHPLQTYVTLYIWQRMALMACFFYFAALVVYLGVRSGRWANPLAGYAACAALFICALLSKENSITLPAVFILAEISFLQSSGKSIAVRSVVYLVLTLALASAVSLLEHPHGNAQLGSGILSTISTYYDEAGLSLKEVAFTQARMVFLYASVFALPSPARAQLISPQVLSHSLLDPVTTFPALVGVMVVVGGSVYFLRRRPLSAFGILFYLVTLLPEGFLVPQYAFLGYRAVLPMFGLYLVVADGLTAALAASERSPGWMLLRPAVVALLAGSIIIAATTTTIRADIWKDPLRFWQETVDHFPTETRDYEPKAAAHALGNLGAALYSAGRYTEAADCYERAIGFGPGDPRKLASLAATYVELGNLDEAKALLVQALEISPDFVTAYRSLAILSMRENKPGEAVRYLRQALHLTPKDAALHENLGMALVAQGDLGEAIQSFSRALQLDPRSASARYQLGQAFVARGDSQDAVVCFQKAIELKPDYWEAYNALGIAQAGQGRFAEALEYFGRALQLDPENPQIRANRETARKQMLLQQQGK